MALFPLHSYYEAAEGANGLSKRPWQTGFWRRAPVSGLLALVFAILCGVATIAVLVASNDLPLDHWRVSGYNVQPTVLLSIFATLANALFRYAFTEGIRVSWWVRAQRGTSLAALHRSWDHAQSAMPIITAGRHVGLTAVTSFLVFMLLVDGPLFQRASSVKVVPRASSNNLIVPVSTSPFMQGATGIYGDHDLASIPTLFTPQFSKILQEYNNRRPITLPEFGCKGKCEFQLIAPGWDIQCDSWDSPYELMSDDEVMPWANAVVHNRTWHGPAQEQTMFWSNVTYYFEASDLWYKLHRYRTGSYPPGVTETDGSIFPLAFPWNTIMLSSMRKSTPGRVGTLTWRYCLLREAVQKYPVTVTNTTVTIRPRDLDQDLTVFKVRRVGETSAIGDWPSTLGGFWLSLLHTFRGTATISSFNQGIIQVNTNDSSPLVYIDVPNATTLNRRDVKWSDPIDDMISMVQELSLRIAIATTVRAPEAPGFVSDYSLLGSQAKQKAEAEALLTATQYYILSPNRTLVNRTLTQNVSASMTYEETVYQSNYDWMVGALVIIGVAFCAILPTFGSWWHLGRTVSFSPLEIAKAFDAPLLLHADPNSTARDIVDDLGTHKVQYGASMSLDGEDRYDPTGANEFASGLEVGRNVLLRRRLHFGQDGSIGSPHEGETFSSAPSHGFIEHSRRSSDESVQSAASFR